MLSHILGEEREVRLVKKKVVASSVAAEPAADIKVTQFVEKVTTEDTTPGTSFFSIKNAYFNGRNL